MPVNDITVDISKFRKNEQNWSYLVLVKEVRKNQLQSQKSSSLILLLTSPSVNGSLELGVISSMAT